MSQATELRPEFLVKDEAELRSLFPGISPIAAQKSISALDRHAMDFIARAPFVCIGTQSADGRADVSPRGDPCGFVKVLDERTLLIPDRPGNNRLDTQSNILANPAIGLIFMVPGFDDTLRINGRAAITRDPDLLSMMGVDGRLPRTAIVVRIEEVFLHCAKAFRRSRLWDPASRQDRSEMPSLAKIILDQIDAAPKDPEEMRKIDEGLEEDYRKSMY